MHEGAGSRSAPECQEGKDEILKSSILNPILDIIRELIVPHPSSMKVFSTLKCVGIKLQLKQGVNS